MRSLVLVLFLLSLAAGAQVTSLVEVSSFDTFATGVAGSRSDNYQAFEAEVARGAAAAPLFERLLQEGRPAAKLYAAVGLYKLDKARGTAALEALRSDGSKVWVTEGCEREETTVGAVATRLLGDNGDSLRAYLR